MPCSASSFENLLQVEPAAVLIDAENLAASLLKNFLGNRRRLVRREYPGRRFANGGNDRCESGSKTSCSSSTTRTGERSNMPGKRQVNCGSSARTVPIPTMMASLAARIWNTRSRAVSTGDRSLLPPRQSGLAVGGNRQLERHVRPTLRHARDVPRMRCGAPRRAQRPISTAMPFARMRSCPCPATSGFGSSSADTTRVMPERITASAQGGVLP